MGKTFDYIKHLVVDFKLDWCCWIIPVRIGLTVIGYFNIFLASISLIGVADDSFTPILVQVQAMILDDNATKPAPVIAYCMELAFNIVLICALYRKDIPLMRVYMKYCIAAIIASFMFYSMVVPAIGAIVSTAMVLSIIFQIYIIILVRSIIVEIRLEQKRQQLPTFVMSTLIQEEKEKEKTETDKVEVDVEAPVPVETEVDEEKKLEVEVETVEEQPKEVTFETVQVK
ncbi:hypothetical protein PYW07_012098 [Mythimna separata]|uniref:Uncharacterized protein n=1 Tax=Mythimna separata TaxID=271217 RepID=A0AAD7YMP7_MYTSE|nr:hypothetical protein PYW07_012098 [Mythimna separata]